MAEIIPSHLGQNRRAPRPPTVAVTCRVTGWWGAVHCAALRLRSATDLRVAGRPALDKATVPVDECLDLFEVDIVVRVGDVLRQSRSVLTDAPIGIDDCNACEIGAIRC